MSHKKHILALLVVASAFTAQKTSATQVELPDWFRDTDSMTQIISSMGAEFDGDLSWLQLWATSLEAQLVEVDKRTAQRRQVYECIRSTFADIESDLVSCNQSVAERNATIASLDNQVSTLEGVITSLTADRNAIAQQIAELHAAYATLLELSGERVDELIVQITTLKAKYKAMRLERDMFRTTLNDYYTRLAAHNHDAKVEGRTLGKELCGSDFSFESNTEA